MKKGAGGPRKKRYKESVMHWSNLLSAVLFPVCFAILVWFFGLIGFDPGETWVRELASAVVAWFVTLFFGDVAKSRFPNRFK